MTSETPTPETAPAALPGGGAAPAPRQSARERSVAASGEAASTNTDAVSRETACRENRAASGEAHRVSRETERDTAAVVAQANPAGERSSENRPTPELPAPPPLLGTWFPGAAERLIAFAEILATDGVVRGLIGPREVPRLWERHLLNCAVVEELIPAGASVGDVGSGAGLPGLVLAIVRPDLRVSLIEASLRRSTFLSETIATLGLTNVEVLRSRAEELPKSTRLDVVVSRAVAPLPKLAAWCAPLLASDGRMLALKGESAEQELVDAAAVLKKLKMRDGRVVRVGGEFVSPPTIVLETTGVQRVNPQRRRVKPKGGRTR